MALATPISGAFFCIRMTDADSIATSVPPPKLKEKEDTKKTITSQSYINSNNY